MPRLPVNPEPRDPAVLSLTEVQYERMRRWAGGDFEDDWSEDGEPTPRPLDELPDMERPHALDRATLEACVGGGFFPGIEVGQIMLEETTYDRNRLFRINAQFSPGTLTARMAVPWQADFLVCSFVVTMMSFSAVGTGGQASVRTMSIAARCGVRGCRPVGLVFRTWWLIGRSWGSS